MKKTIAVVTALALAAGAVFAVDLGDGLSIGFWGRGVFAPFAYNTETETGGAGLGVAWDGKKIPRMGITVSGASEAAGFSAELYAVPLAAVDAVVPLGESDIDIKDIGIGDIFRPGDNVKVWVKPFEFLKITAGKYFEDDLWGKVGDDLQGVLLYDPTGWNPDIFQRIGADTGVNVALTPVPALYIGMNITRLVDIWNPGAGEEAAKGWSDEALENAYKYSQISLGCKVGDAVHIRAQYDGRDGEDKEYGQVAVAYTGVPGLTVDGSFKHFLTDSAGADYFLAAASYGSAEKAGGLTGLARVKGTLPQGDDGYFGLGIDAEAEYGLTGKLGVGGQAAFGLNDGGEDRNFIGLTAYVRKTLANGKIAAGITSRIPVGDASEETGAVLAFPITFDISF